MLSEIGSGNAFAYMATNEDVSELGYKLDNYTKPSPPNHNQSGHHDEL